MLNFIEYSVPCIFLLDNPISLSLDNMKVTIASSSKSLLIKFESDEEVDESSFEDLVLLELEKLLDKLAFAYSITFEEPFEISRRIGNVEKIASQMTAKFSIANPPLTTEQSDQLKQNLEYNVRDNTLLRMYRLAIKNNNPMERFFLLYGIIYLLFRNQEKVDSFIKTTSGYDSSKEKVSGNRERSDKETIYTWLRNQIAHMNRSTNIKDIRMQIISNLNEFQNIVKEAMKLKNNGLRNF
ncbi:methylamine utilization protein MauJ [Paenibacillus sp. GXUN7292]|uniref:methylamine utilization protein MauJ n=1 Tax=Paenibacillus sp. GXUN7292 TaxID=3422499 RepID=UPI003D7CB3EC